MAANAALTYDQVYQMVKDGYKGDSSIWDQAYAYIHLHPNELFHITSNRRWSIGHQIIYHGNLKLFKSLLTLYNETNPINIYSTTKDNPTPKTILDIARERQGYYKEQYTYIEHLFDQDKFIQACKIYNWPMIDQMLDKDRTLLNEKPPYDSNYFLHYLVLYGDIRKFDQYNLPDNKFQLDLKNTDGKTALDLARETKNEGFIDEIQRLLPVCSREADTNRDDRRSPDPLSSSSNIQYTVPTPSTVTPQTLRNLTCILTKRIFIDPVLASDGKTYERKAIIEWRRTNRYSPQTGEILDDTFTENTEIKNLIRHLRQQKLLA